MTVPVGAFHDCSNDCDEAYIQDGNTLVINVFQSNSGRYLISVSNLTNPRKVGQTGQFEFKTFQGDDQILGGLASALVTLPNSMTAWLSAD